MSPLLCTSLCPISSFAYPGPVPTPPRALVMVAGLEITHLQNLLSHLIEVGPGTGRHSEDTSPPPSPLFPLGPETPGLVR